MIKVCLSLALASAFALSISAQATQQASATPANENNIKKDQSPIADDKTSPTPQITENEVSLSPEKPVVTEVTLREEAQAKTAAPPAEKPVNVPEIKKEEAVPTKEMQRASVPLVKKTETIRTYSTGNPQIDRYITEACEKYGVDPLLIVAQMKQESSFNRGATSHKGARGLMQLMPDTARRFGVRNIYNPKQNIDAGVKYMRWLLDKFGGDVDLALAGYNAGEGAVMKYGNQIPPYRETKSYVKRITAHYAELSASLSEQVAVLEPSNQ
jgi:soluble lytic murein transglycosylase-like protein